MSKFKQKIIKVINDRQDEFEQLIFNNISNSKNNHFTIKKLSNFSYDINLICKVHNIDYDILEEIYNIYSIVEHRLFKELTQRYNTNNKTKWNISIKDNEYHFNLLI